MRFYTRKRRMPAVIIVSLIDILAILLIFVIVTTTFKRDQPAVVINLPDSKTATAAPTQNDPAILTISSDKKLFLDNKPIELGDLKEALLQMLAAHAAKFRVVTYQIGELASLLDEIASGQSRDPLLESRYAEELGQHDAGVLET